MLSPPSCGPSMDFTIPPALVPIPFQRLFTRLRNRPGQRRLPVLIALAGATGLALVPAGSGAADIPSAEELRPAELVLLEERTTMEGKQAIGILKASADPSEPGLWRVKVWDERPNQTLVRDETVRCRTTDPMRVTSDGRHRMLRFLNPGGVITPANRRDHLVWWAVCFPEQAGRDPAQLGPTARRLGFSGHLVERELVVPSGQR